MIRLGPGQDFRDHTTATLCHLQNSVSSASLALIVPSSSSLNLYILP